MAKINRLTNQTREKIRAPFLPEAVSRDLLAALFPSIRKTASRHVQMPREQKKAGNRPDGKHAAAKTKPQPYANRNGAQSHKENVNGISASPGTAAGPSRPIQTVDDNSRQIDSGAPANELQPSGTKPGEPLGAGSKRPPGLFLPTNRVVQPGNRNGNSRQSSPSPAVPPTRPVQQTPAQNSISKINGRHDSSSTRNGFSHHPGVLRSKPVPQHFDAPKPKPLQAHQEPPTQLPLNEVPPVILPTSVKPVIPAVPRQQPERSLQGLRQLLAQHPNLPAQTSLLGVCDDGLPVLLDLNDPKPGALVIMGDERELQLDLLRSAIASLAMRNTPRGVQILIISHEAQAWRDWVTAQGYQKFCIGIEGVDDLEVLSDWVMRLADWAEQRRTGDLSGPPVLVVLDTLSFMPRLAYDIRLNFEWMAKEGPPAQIWPLAAISTELANLLNNRRMLRSFRTRVLGFSENTSFYSEVGGLRSEEASQFGEPGVFAVQLGEEWLRFRLPEPKNT